MNSHILAAQAPYIRFCFGSPMKNFLAAVICVAIAAFARDARAQGDAAAGKELFKSNCSPCHGESGKGDGPGGQVLPVKPANLGERIGATRYSDQYLFDVIAKGGASVGKSNFMPAWS